MKDPQEPIDVECWVVKDADDRPLEPERPMETDLQTMKRLASKVPFIVWVWIFGITLVGLTEGLW